jgi:hypothetical protein
MLLRSRLANQPTKEEWHSGRMPAWRRLRDDSFILELFNDIVWTLEFMRVQNNVAVVVYDDGADMSGDGSSLHSSGVTEENMLHYSGRCCNMVSS